MKQTVWLKVTQDEYELPILVADTAEELGYMDGGKSRNAVLSLLSHYRHGKLRTCPYRKVVIDVQDD